MKKLLHLVMVFLLILALTACSAGAPAAMSIQPSKFSEETKKVLDLLDDEMQFFDIRLDESIKSYTISVWAYRDGEWHEDGKIDVENIVPNGQIAIRLTESSCGLYVIDDTGHSKYGYPVIETDFENAVGIGGTRIEKETPIELHKEIPIWVKIGTDKSSMRAMDITENFRAYDCNAGVAITLIVSDELVT